MKQAHLANLGKLYQDVMHNTLFFEVLHQLPHGLGIVLAAVSDLAEKHGTPMAFVLAITVSLLRRLRFLNPLGGPVGMKPRRQNRHNQKRGNKAQSKLVARSPRPLADLAGKKPRKQRRVPQKRDEKGRFV